MHNIVHINANGVLRIGWQKQAIFNAVACLVHVLCNTAPQFHMHELQSCHWPQAIRGAGADWSIFNPASSWQRREVAQLYGCNDMGTGRPNFLYMAGEWLTYPVYVVQVCVPVCNYDT